MTHPQQKQVQQARRVTVTVSIGGHDATSVPAPYLIDFSYTDHVDGKADDVQLKLHDLQGVSMNVGSLGDIIFETSDARVLTLQSFKKSQEATYEEHSVLGAASRFEFVHVGLSTLDMSIMLRADLGVDPLKEAERLDAYCAEGAILRLVLAGVNLGKFTLRIVSQEWKHLHRGTGPQQISIIIQLKGYI